MLGRVGTDYKHKERRMATVDEEVSAGVGYTAALDVIVGEGAIVIHRAEVDGVTYMVSASALEGEATALDVWQEGSKGSRWWRRVSRRNSGARWRAQLDVAGWRAMGARALEAYVALHVAPLPAPLAGRMIGLSHKTSKGWRAHLEDGPSPGLSTVYFPTLQEALASLASVSDVEEVSAMRLAELEREKT